MKTKNIKTRFGVAILLLHAITQAQAGREGGNGGDAFAQRFNMIGRSLYENFDRLGIPRNAGITAEALKQTVNTTTVATVDHAILGDREVDAINYPDQKLIQLNRSRWESMPNDYEKMVSLVLHEYLSIAGVDDDHYQVSGIVLKNLEPVLQKPLDQPYRYACTVMSNIGSSGSGIIGIIGRETRTNPFYGSAFYTVTSFDMGQEASVNQSLSSVDNPWEGGPFANNWIQAVADWAIDFGEYPEVLRIRIIQDFQDTQHRDVILNDWTPVEFKDSDRSEPLSLLNDQLKLQCYRYHSSTQNQERIEK